MFLQVIWNSSLKQTSLIVSSTQSYEDYPVIISFPLKEDISTDFVQNFIGFPELEFLYIEDKFLWLENYHLTKNILAFFNVLDYIELTDNHLHEINIFIQKQQLSTNDFDNLGFQSPVKTVPRDLSTNPAFMKSFLNISDVSKRLLRTTFSFIDNDFVITINKREVKSQQFFNHLNSDIDRLRIKQSLAYPFEDKQLFVSYISSLEVFSNDNNTLEPINYEADNISQEDSSENTSEIATSATDQAEVGNSVSIIDNMTDNEIYSVENFQDTDNFTNPDVSDLKNITENIGINLLKKEQIISLELNEFLTSANVVVEKKLEHHTKVEDVLENFTDNSDNNFDDFFSAERTSEDFSLPESSYSIEEYDNSVFIEQKLEENTSSKIDIDSVEEELTEEFLVEIESNLKKHELSISQAEQEQLYDTVEEDNVIQTISVDDLVDSINNIIEEPEPTLELIDIIDLPIILFLSKAQPVILDSFIDNYFVDSDVNEEINHFSAEEVLNVVKTEVSIFENTVSDKKKKNGKNKKEKLAVLDKKDNVHPEFIPSIEQDNSFINEDQHAINNYLEITNELVDNHILTTEVLDTTQLVSVEQQYIVAQEHSDDVFSFENILEKTDLVMLPIYPFLQRVEIKAPLLIHSVTSLFIIDFLISAEIVDDGLVMEEIEPNFNFFEENKKKLIELSLAGELDLIDDLYRNYPEFEKPLINFNYEGDNPICIAAFYENLDLLKKLIEYGWDANYFDSNLNNALIIASAEGHKHIVRYLLTQNIQINFQNKIGYTALHFAVNDCNHRIVKLLLDAGADVEISDNDRNTALSIAAFKGDINSTKLLLQTRVNVHIKNKKGYDARSIALIAKNHAVAKLIEDKIVSEKHNHSLPPIIEKTFEKHT